MSDIDSILTNIVTTVTKSNRSDSEKADIMAQLTVGMHRLVWPILLSHVPEYLLKEVTNKDSMTLDDYQELLDSALQNPATAKEIHDELKDALLEVEALVGV